jgi:hypothetical protein
VKPTPTDSRPRAERSTPSLRELQAEFLRGMRGEAGASDLAAEGVFLEPPAATSAARFDVYREGYELRLAGVIENDYPAVARILGEGPFRNLIHRYLARFPPHSHDVGRAGDHLARHLENDPLSENLPFLPELARFEAALSAGVVARDVEPWTRVAIAALGEALLDRPLAWAPGAAFLRSRWPLGDLWQLRDQADEDIELQVDGRPTDVVVFRHGLRVLWREVSSDEAAFLAAIDGRCSLLDLCDSGRFGEPETAAPHLATLAVALLESNVLTLAVRDAASPSDAIPTVPSETPTDGSIDGAGHRPEVSSGHNATKEKRT